MPFDPKKIRLRTTRRAKETDPEAIFESLTLRGSIENLWSPRVAPMIFRSRLSTREGFFGKSSGLRSKRRIAGARWR